MKLKFSAGFGSLIIDPYMTQSSQIGEILLNRYYNPVLNVALNVEDVRHNEFTNYDKLTLEVKTNGAISPSDAVSLASGLLRDMFEVFINFDEKLLSSSINSRVNMPIESNKIKVSDDMLLKPISEFEFSVRTWNCMQSMGIKYVGELVSKSERDLLKRKNFGRKSLNEVKEVLSQYGLFLASDSSDENEDAD